MDAVVDLAARATSFITLVQDIFVKGTDPAVPPERIKLEAIFCADFRKEFEKSLAHYIRLDLKELKAIQQKRQKNEPEQEYPEPVSNFYKRAVELVWISSAEPDIAIAGDYTKDILVKLTAWIYSHREFLFGQLKSTGSLPTPYNWRDAISNLLYTKSEGSAQLEEPAQLARILQYLPIQVVLALGGGSYDVQEQRLMQLWEANPRDIERLLNTNEQARYEELQEVLQKNSPLEIETVINDSYTLTQKLREDAPLPFELVFTAELEEIRKCRELRYNERCVANAVQRKRKDTKTVEEAERLSSENPMAVAKAMKLYALAFSGGGIRSATFNLGVLQGLAREGLIGQFDYLSTVSGGGYIGSWLAAWIQREGSVNKVSNRLSPEKSPDPFAEEVRPIRWLRMFSNYFTPNASIMSVDAWTVGVTWFRNTLLTQVIIALLLLSGLLGIRFLYELWVNISFWNMKTNGTVVYIVGTILLLTIALLAGLGMRAYHSGKLARNPVKREKTRGISMFISIITFAGAFMVSASFLWKKAGANLDLTEDLVDKVKYLIPAGLTILFSLLLIAWLGKYGRCIVSYGKSVAFSRANIIITAVLSAAVAVVCLALGWILLQHICVHCESNKMQPGQIGWLDTYVNWLPGMYDRLAFIAGIPIVLLVFGITVVVRMALLGRYFPDERREWWGRMGAGSSRAAFIFALLAGSSLLGMELANYVMAGNLGWKAPATVGGWLALVGSTVKAAFSGKTSGKGDENSASAMALDLLCKAGPYIFALGLLIFLPALLIPLYRLNLFYFDFIEQNNAIKTFLLMLIMFVPSFLLAQRVGVNEFSMHHFYRNRLVRAYLGATRRNTDRIKTANPFTNFDMNDDVKLSSLTHKAGYFGPYPILNTALNASSTLSLDRQDRKAESFTFSPLYCGFDFSMTRASAAMQTKSYDYGYRPTERFAYTSGAGPGIGTAMAISGAAVNPNQGFHSSAGTAFLLTVFNVQMGWWIGNPRKSKWNRADPESGLGYIISNLTGSTSTRQDFVCLSDGGHFDNMGLYELVRRRCTFIVLGDGEQDDKFTCEGLANAIRRCRIDFGAEIDIDVEPIRNRDEHGFSKSQYALGTIRYAGDDTPGGVLLYIKSSIKSQKPVDVSEYSLKNKTFPHQTTADQFFDEAQFESYRQLGLQIVYEAFRDNSVVDKLGFMRLPKSAAPPVPSPGITSSLSGSVWERVKDVFYRITKR